MNIAAGRNCPLHYRYRPAVFNTAAALNTDTVYIIGGLYGNVESLRTILKMKQQEENRTQAEVRLLFNGDFNWFNIDAADFQEINETVLNHQALQGNVEAELASAGASAGCGCNYPDYVDQAVVERSNLIMQRLQQQGLHFSDIRQRLAALPMHLTIAVSGNKIGVLHGDPESLSGWGFAVEALQSAEHRSEDKRGGDGMQPATTAEQIEGYFSEANVLAFACTHTGLPFLQDFRVNGSERLIINNGAAGMPNFKGARYGILTRISSRSEQPEHALYGATLENLRFDALAIRYDHPAWIARFLRNWPEGSPAHDSYFHRITEGPDFHVEQAMRLSTTLAA